VLVPKKLQSQPVTTAVKQVTWPVTVPSLRAKTLPMLGKPTRSATIAEKSDISLVIALRNQLPATAAHRKLKDHEVNNVIIAMVMVISHVIVLFHQRLVQTIDRTTIVKAENNKNVINVASLDISQEIVQTLPLKTMVVINRGHTVAKKVP